MARLFNGTNQYADTGTIRFSLYNLISMSFWFWWDTAGSTEYPSIINSTGNLNSGNRFDFEGQYDAGTCGIAMSTSNFWADKFPQPSAAAWHHYLCVYDRVTPINVAYVDGVLQTLTTVAHQAQSGNFTDAGLRIMRYSSGALYSAGRLADVAIWGGVKFGKGEAAELSKGISPLSVRPDRLLAYMPLTGKNREPVYGRMGALDSNIVTFTNAPVATAHPLNLRNHIAQPRKAVFA